MKRIQKSLWLPALLFIYATALFVYYLVWGGVSLDLRTAGIMGVTYLLVAIVWFLNQRREREAKNKNRNNP